ncbi:hypothetical protein GGP57_002187 [Salinibacter ruber]|uniref:hypothetical protein n=1 Tax=Salinibacter ruber TaxID=146919 RepID=UPI002168E1D7|nr:hypothetical protein [Salinibacter ruber]MCS3634854.1 hypothetical protein [Salinibacter ruber]MCS3714671.1 hypothetical protein [Salinibacter ruber]
MSTEQKNGNSQSLIQYEASLQSTISWVDRSIGENHEGSSAYFGAWGKWADPYPETTGYLIPTLLDYAEYSSSTDPVETAYGLGEWLLSIQADEGFWHGMTHPPAEPNPSVFNTAQILLGLCALHRHGKDDGPWLSAAQKGVCWLVDGLGSAGRWSDGNYQGEFNPSYYTRVAWPLLEVWALTGNPDVRDAAVRVLSRILERRQNTGEFSGWGFEPNAPAFTHTIAYTLRGFLESARLLDDWSTYGEPAEEALNLLYRHAELSNGTLPGKYGEGWEKNTGFTCLTGNAQVAICLLKYESRESDLRLVNAACKLVDEVMNCQSQSHLVSGIQGAIPGSSPLWGKYMRFRYPNWAAKFYCDALLLLIPRLREEGL